MFADGTRFSVAADIVLAIHFAFVLFVVGGFVVIWIGRALDWSFVRNFAFRMAHLLAIGVVALQAVANVPCPLTVWELRLRERAGQPVYAETCMEHWLGRVLFYELDPWVFTLTYIAFFLLVVLTIWKIPPRRPGWFSSPG